MYKLYSVWHNYDWQGDVKGVRPVEILHHKFQKVVSRELFGRPGLRL